VSFPEVILDNVIYGIFQAFGYGHPFHPVLVHLVIGPVLAAFILFLVGLIFKKPALYRTARHMTVLAFVCWFFTVGMGVIDWIHFYKSAQLTEIIIKSITSGILFIILLSVIMLRRRLNVESKINLVFYSAAVAAVLVLGFFGANLVYINKTADAPLTEKSRALAGSDSFQKVEKEGYTLMWRVNGANLDVTVSYATTGWIGVGFGRKGTMEGADIKIGYVDKGRAVILDSFGDAPDSHSAKQVLGGKSTVTNASGSEVNGVTTLSFTRPLDSGDKNDLVLVPGTEYTVIMAHGDPGAKDFESYHSGGHIAFKIKL
jgi:uncharacterized membrane protein